MDGRRAKVIASVLALLCVCAVAFAALGVPATGPAARSADAPWQSDSAAEGDASAAPTASTSAALPTAPSSSPDAELSAYEPGFVLATLADGATLENMLDELASDPALADVTFDSSVSDDIVKLALPQDIDAAEGAMLVEAASSIESAQPNYRLYTQEDAALVSAPIAAATSLEAASSGTSLEAAAASGSSGITNDTYVDRQWTLPSVNAPQAWESVSAVSGPSIKPVTVAVLDAGFDVNHEDLKNNIVATYDITKNRSTILPVNKQPKQTDHGTHSASIIAAQTNNGIGVAGATNNSCKVLPIRVEDENGNLYISSVASALMYVYNNADTFNIRVVNMSLGGASEDPVSRDSCPALYDPIDKLLNDKGILTVVAACNNGTNGYSAPFYAFPSDFDNVVSVINLAQSSASQYNGVARSSTSNYNKGTQRAKKVSAPGDQVPGAVYRSTYDTSFEGKYGSMSGTSMAAPLVSGIAALMFTVNPSLTPREVESALCNTATKIGPNVWNAETGYGEVNAYAAVKAVAPYFDNPPSSIAWNGSASFKVKVGDAEQAASSWTWASSNTSVALVSTGGVVTPRGNGTTTITATKDGVTLSKQVSVSWPKLAGTASLVAGQTAAFSVVAGGVTQTGWTWATSNSNVATVTSAGLVSAVGAGNATIFATSGSTTLTMQVKVERDPAETAGEGATGSGAGGDAAGEGATGGGTAGSGTAGSGTTSGGATGGGTTGGSGDGSSAGGNGSTGSGTTGSGTTGGGTTDGGTASSGEVGGGTTGGGTTGGSGTGSSAGGNGSSSGNGSTGGSSTGDNGSSGGASTGGSSAGDTSTGNNPSAGSGSSTGNNASGDGTPTGNNPANDSGSTSGSDSTAGTPPTGSTPAGGTPPTGSTPAGGSESASSSGIPTDTSPADGASPSTPNASEGRASVDLSALAISIPSVTYTGKAQRPDPVVTDRGTRLIEGVDYRVIFPTCVNAGTYTVTISAMSGSAYTGSVDRPFVVSKADLSSATVKLSAAKLEYTGSKLKANVTSVALRIAGETRELTPLVDYTVSNPGTKKGSAKVTVSGVGNFTGKATASYRVKVTSANVYQLFNKSARQWSYTMSMQQRAHLKAQGWTAKGVAFKMPTRSTKPVYLMENRDSGVRRLIVGTASMRKLRSSGWSSLQIAFYASDGKAKPVYTFYNKKTGSYRYSTAKSLPGFTRKGTLCHSL